MADGTRRLARITVDVLLPASYFDVDLSDCEVAAVTMRDDDSRIMTILRSEVVPAHIVVTEGGTD